MESHRSMVILGGDDRSFETSDAAAVKAMPSDRLQAAPSPALQIPGPRHGARFAGARALPVLIIAVAKW